MMYTDWPFSRTGSWWQRGHSYNGTQYVFALVRYNTNGSLDTTFGTGGNEVTTAIGTNDVATSWPFSRTGG